MPRLMVKCPEGQCVTVTTPGDEEIVIRFRRKGSAVELCIEAPAGHHVLRGGLAPCERTRRYRERQRARLQQIRA